MSTRTEYEVRRHYTDGWNKVRRTIDLKLARDEVARSKDAHPHIPVTIVRRHIIETPGEWEVFE